MFPLSMEALLITSSGLQEIMTLHADAKHITWMQDPRISKKLTSASCPVFRPTMLRELKIVGKKKHFITNICFFHGQANTRCWVFLNQQINLPDLFKRGKLEWMHTHTRTMNLYFQTIFSSLKSFICLQPTVGTSLPAPPCILVWTTNSEISGVVIQKHFQSPSPAQFNPEVWLIIPCNMAAACDLRCAQHPL